MTPALPLRKGVLVGTGLPAAGVDLGSPPDAGSPMAADVVDMFTHAVAHDLRAPLRAIDAYAQALADDYAHRLPIEAQHMLGRLRTASETLEQRVAGLLRLSHVSQHPLRCSPCDLAPALTRVLADLRRQDPERVVVVTVPSAVPVDGDAALLGIVVENLLSNAWKFTRGRADARIDVALSRCDHTDVLSVRDNGVGLDMTQAHRLGLPFQRLHPAASHDGTGIGLATSRRIIERHGGTLWADGAPDAGATFHVALPSVRTR